MGNDESKPGHEPVKYPVYLEAELIKRLQGILADASAREADPEAEVFEILDAVRAARRLATHGG
ncbi:hypothetical protein ABRY74_23185 [Pseudomonas guariconensis]|uniref:hypothetical protein n=1 Tax=Pseudomonas guariconensis TaxID=1288410 RepID=UPI003EDFA847